MQQEFKLQTGVGDYPDAVNTLIVVSIVTGVLLSLWIKSTVHGTNREGCSPNNSGKESLTISVLTLANEPMAQPW